MGGGATATGNPEETEGRNFLNLLGRGGNAWREAGGTYDPPTW